MMIRVTCARGHEYQMPAAFHSMPCPRCEAVSCEECNDAPGTNEVWFNGVTKMMICDGCRAWWENHALIEERRK